MIFDIFMDIGLLSLGEKYSFNTIVPGDSNLSYFLWSILSSCHLAIVSLMFGFSYPPHKRPDYCGKTVHFTLK